MKFIVSLILIIVTSFAACIYFPWWSIAVTSFLIAVLIPQKALISFLCGFFALFLLWGSLAVWISQNNNNILAHKISVLVLKSDSPSLLILLTALIGAFTAGFACLAGSYLRNKPGGSLSSAEAFQGASD